MAHAPAYVAPRPQKDSAVAAILALLLGFFGILGIGHIYVGKLAKGIILLVVGLLFGPLVFIFVFFSFMPFVASGPGIGMGVAFPFILVLVIAGAAWLVLLIWSTVDAYRLAGEYNSHVAATGAPPW